MGSSSFIMGWRVYVPSSARFSAAIQNGASGRPRPTKGDPYRAGGPGVPPLRVEWFSHGGRPRGSPLHLFETWRTGESPLGRFSAAIQNGAPSRRALQMESPSIAGGHMGPPLRRIKRWVRFCVGAGHWPARRRNFAISEPTFIRPACARHLLPGREKAFGQLIAAPTGI